MREASLVKKILPLLFVVTAWLHASPKAVILDWGGVMGREDRSAVVHFLCQTFQFSNSAFEKADLACIKAVQAGQSDVDFWMQLAQEKGVQLPKDWATVYTAQLEKSVGADPKMYALVDGLKRKNLRVGLLSNTNPRRAKLLRDLGFYKPFQPCLLSCETGLRKPDPQAYAFLLKTLSLPAQDVIFIDNRMENVRAAKKIG